MSKITVSIIIPCYNGEEFIEKNLKIINADELENKEIIIINDGSTDKSLNILNKLAKKQKNLIVINQKNSGQGVARNKGIKLAKGEYICFLDIDDFIANNAIKKMYDFAKKNKSDYVYCNYYKHYNDHDELIINHHSDDNKKDAMLTNFAPWGKLISKKLIDECKFQFCEGIIYEDIAVIPYLGVSSKNPCYLKEALYFYTMTNTSTLRKKEYDKKYEDIIFVSDYLYKKFSDNRLLDEYYDELKYIYLDSILKSGVLKFSDFKEGIKNIKILRRNVKAKFSNFLNNKYYKVEPLYRKMTVFIALYFPPYIIYLLKKITKEV